MGFLSHIVLLGLTSATVVQGWEWSTLTTMSWQPGDQIYCRIAWTAQDHYMLGAEGRKLIHVKLYAEDGGRKIEEVYDTDIDSSKITTSKCWNMGQGLYSKYAVHRARRAVGKTWYYHWITCNSQHWVKYWAGSNTCVNQSGSGASGSCFLAP